LKILYDNQITTTTTITPSSEDSNFPFETALFDKRLTRFGRTLGIISENIVFYNSDGFAFDEVLIANNNFTDSATVTIQANASDSWGAPSVSQVLTKYNNDYYYYTFDSVQEYDYVRLLIADSTNTDDYLKLTKIYIGDSITMPGINPSVDLPITTNSKVYENETGQIYTDKRTQMYGATVKFPIITETQRQSIKTMFTRVDITEPFFLLIWEDDLDVEPPLYARLTNEPAFKKLDNLLWTLDFSFRECK